MGSEPGQRANRPNPLLFIKDTFKHDLLKHLVAEDQVLNLYVQDKLSLKQIALRMGVSRDFVRKALFKKGIQVIHGRRETDLTGQIPYGWRKLKGKLTPYRKEQEVIERIKRARERGLSLREISRRLNESGIATKEGGRWHAKSLSQILNRLKRTTI